MQCCPLRISSNTRAFEMKWEIIGFFHLEDGGDLSSGGGNGSGGAGDKKALG